MKYFIAFVLLACGCLNDPYAPPAHYVINDPYCWHENKDGKWEVVGLANRCPPNTRSYVQRLKPVKPSFD